MNDTEEQKSSPMPNFYVSPWQTPLYWGDEQTGVLPKAVMAFHAHMLDKSKLFEGVQFALVRAYLKYYIDAPCWHENSDQIEGKLAELRASVQGIKTPEEMHEWIMQCLDLGIDPL